ncbi:MAG: 5'-methylthioadenosine/adenosylhomocysteine nucleosidase [Brevinema sp.]
MIGLVGAMEEEIVLLREHVEDIKTTLYAGITFCHGKINGKPIVLCKSGVGKVNAACAALLMTLHFNATSLIFSGIAGGVASDVNIGDIVVAEDTLYHDMDATAMGWKLSEIPDGSTSLFPCNPELSSIIEIHGKSLFGEDAIHRGRIVSGDQFIADKEKVAFFRQKFQAVAVDMESAAFAHAASKLHVPCCIIRSISDKSDDSASVDYPTFANESAQRSSQLIVNSIAYIH